jgi:vacuolar-type H+-ATPase subunit E/Vma4
MAYTEIMRAREAQRIAEQAAEKAAKIAEAAKAAKESKQARAAAKADASAEKPDEVSGSEDAPAAPKKKQRKS